MITIKPVDELSQDVIELITQLDAYLGALYPTESNHLTSVDELLSEHAVLLGAYRNNKLLACGGILFIEQTYAELKRLFVRPDARGNGVAKKLLAALENTAQTQHIDCLRLETGINQPEAIALYKKAGYQYIEPFGDYAADPMSVFMQKRVSAQIQFVASTP